MWKLRGGVQIGDIEQRSRELSQALGISELTARVCILRGLHDPEKISRFLMPSLADLKDPFSIKDMSLAMQRMVQACESGEKIRVFGDYDVDGTTGAALLGLVLTEAQMVVDIRQPDRFKDGYGLNVGAVEQAVKEGVGLLITVDCGITSFAALDRARELGLEVIVIDHHQIDPSKGVPPAHAVLNPQRADCESGLKELCGCGLAFYFARALKRTGVEQGWWEEVGGLNLKSHLDLVVIATAADMVPLIGDNHIMMRHGWNVLKQSSKAGVRALLQAAQVDPAKLKPSHLGFTLGPRINASGRLGSADLALKLLMEENPERANSMAQELERINAERASIQDGIWDQVKAEVEVGISEGRFKAAVVVGKEGWHEGVVGIVASRVTEHFKKPAIVLNIHEGRAKGSVRSYGGKDVLAALRACASFLTGFGGHKHAAGLHLPEANLIEFSRNFDQAIAALPESVSETLIEGDCEISDLNLKTLAELERLGPFGVGNPEPVFRVKGDVKSRREIKERHLKLDLAPVGTPRGSQSSSMEVIWFHAVDHSEKLGDLLGKTITLAAVPEINSFRNQVKPVLRVKDWLI